MRKNNQVLPDRTQDMDAQRQPDLLDEAFGGNEGIAAVIDQV